MELTRRNAVTTLGEGLVTACVAPLRPGRRAARARRNRRWLATVPRAVLTSVTAAMVLGVLALLPVLAGCSMWSEPVVRIHDGRRVAGDEISSEAYAASFAAALAEAKGDFATEVTWLRRALTEGEDDALRTRLGRALCRSGQYAPAMAEFEGILRRDPSSEAAYSFRAECEASRGLRREASEDRRRALRADPSALEPSLAWLAHDVHDTRDAHVDLVARRFRSEELVEQHPTSAEAWATLLRVCLDAGDVAGAQRAWARVVVLDDGLSQRLRGQLIASTQQAACALPERERQAHGALVATPSSPPASASPHTKASCSRFTDAGSALGTMSAAERSAVFDIWHLLCPAHERQLDALESRWAMTVYAPNTPAGASPSAAWAHLHTSTSLEARARGERLSLRVLAIPEVLQVLSSRWPTAPQDFVPWSTFGEESRLRRALRLAHEAYQRAVTSDASGFRQRAERALELGPAEPTVTRLLAAAAQKLGSVSAPAYHQRACALASTEAEMVGCSSP